MTKFIPVENRLRHQGVRLIAGIDEAGRGPLAGPVVSAAVILKPGAQLSGLNDSKKLTPLERERLFPLIIENALDFAITFVPHQVIDRINILNAVRLANQLCVKNLRHHPDMVLIDGRDRQILNVPYQTIIKGDSKIRSIAAASILAKVSRDYLMRYYAREFSLYGFERHMGYGTRQHRQNIKKFGLCPIHRKSYSMGTEKLAEKSAAPGKYFTKTTKALSKS